MPKKNASLATERGVWRYAYRELLRPRTVAIAVASAVLFTVAMTVFAPLGTSALRPLLRFAYWGLCTVVTFPACYALAAVVLYLGRLRSLMEMVPAIVAAVLIEGLLCTAVMVAASILFVSAPVVPLSPATTYLTATIVVAVCTFFAHYVTFLRISHERAAAGTGGSSQAATPPSRRHDAMPTAASASGSVPSGGPERPGTTTHGDSLPPRSGSTRGTVVPFRPTRITPGRVRAADHGSLTASQARFMERLSRAVSRDVIYLKVDDHYVHVHTTGGSCLIMIRFADAVADLGSLGMRVHRSYWVAHRHMLTTVRAGGRTMLRVTGGQNVPVSRPNLPAVHDALRAKVRKGSPP